MRTLGVLSLFVGLLCAAETARANELPAQCDVHLIEAQKTGSGSVIDPQIQRLRPYLEQPPFTAWNRFHFVETKHFQIARNATVTFQLPNSHAGTLTYLGHLIESGKHRLRLQLGIVHVHKPEMRTVFVLDEGGLVLQAGQHLKGGGLLILGVTCKTD